MRREGLRLGGRRYPDYSTRLVAPSGTLTFLAVSSTTCVRRAPATSRTGEQDAAAPLYYMLAMYEDEAPGWKPCLGRPVALGLEGKEPMHDTGSRLFALTLTGRLF